MPMFTPSPGKRASIQLLGKLGKCLLRTGTLIHLKISRNNLAHYSDSKQEGWLSWDWSMLTKLVEAKDEADDGHGQKELM